MSWTRVYCRSAIYLAVLKPSRLLLDLGLVLTWHDEVDRRWAGKKGNCFFISLLTTQSPPPHSLHPATEIIICIEPMCIYEMDICILLGYWVLSLMFMFSHWWILKLRSFMIWHYVVSSTCQCAGGTCCLHLKGRRWRQHDHPKHLYVSTKLHSVTSQTTFKFMKDSDTTTHTVFICFIQWEEKQFTTL